MRRITGVGGAGGAHEIVAVPQVLESELNLVRRAARGDARGPTSRRVLVYVRTVRALALEIGV